MKKTCNTKKCEMILYGYRIIDNIWNAESKYHNYLLLIKSYRQNYRTKSNQNKPVVRKTHTISKVFNIVKTYHIELLTFMQALKQFIYFFLFLKNCFNTLLINFSFA